MRTIGITGGVGSGKTQLLTYIEEHYNCVVLYADEVAHRVKEPGEPCYDKLIQLLGTDILDKNGYIQKQVMADIIFKDRLLLAKVNGIIHPAVKDYIQSQLEWNMSQSVEFFFLEAALLIEEHYDTILDELWYIYASETVRRERLVKSRQYSEEKINSIMREQLSETVFREKCKVVIDNSGDLEWAYKQIDEKLREYHGR